jgi:hypothetical protein
VPDVSGSRRSVVVFEKWLEAHVDERGLDRELAPSEPNFILLGAVIEPMLAASARK